MNNPHKKLVDEIHLFGEMNFDYLELTIEHPHARPEFIEKNKKEGTWGDTFLDKILDIVKEK